MPLDVNRNAAVNPHDRSPSAQSGFSLVEVLVTVVIITVMSTIALPVLRDGMRDRRTRQAAEEIARVFREARFRAMGRGSAVLVHYVDASRSFEIREAVTGPPPGAAAPCRRLPATNCLLAGWTREADSARGSQPIETYRFDNTTETTGIKVAVALPAAPDSEMKEFSVCFTPLGRTYAVAGGPVFTSASVMTYAPVFRVWRTDLGATKRIGLERRVTLLPNGQTRLHSARAQE